MATTESLIFRSVIRGLAICAIAIPGLTSDACGQSISRSNPPAESSTTRRLPNPIRQAAHREPIDTPPNIDIPPKIGDSSVIANPDRGDESMVAESGWGYGSGTPDDLPLSGLDQPPKHPHQILRAPQSPSTGKKSPFSHESIHPSKRLVHPPFSSHRRRVQPAPATLPGANQKASWKTPYSYGYFGGSGTRHWSLHHGARDRYTEWVLQ